MDVVLIVLLVAIVIPIVFTVVTMIQNKSKTKSRNAINNSIAGLLEKKAITATGGNHEKLSRTPGYKPANLVEQAIIAHGFDNKKRVNAKDFHVNLRKKINYLRTAVDNTDSTLLDFETKPKERVSSSSNDDSGLILPLVIFGGMDGSGSSHANDTYTSDSDYSSGGFDGNGGSFDGGGFSGGDSGGGDSGGGGDGGGGGGGD